MRARVHECIQSDNRLTRGPSASHVVSAVVHERAKSPCFPLTRGKWMPSGILVNDDREMDLVPSSAFFFYFLFALALDFVYACNLSAVKRARDSFTCLISRIYVSCNRLQRILYCIPPSYLGSARLMFYDTSSRLVWSLAFRGRGDRFFPKLDKSCWKRWMLILFALRSLLSWSLRSDRID